ncbi:MAG TPA: hypothetical protein VMU14_23675 [Acidimicrobiales bacterium]|nr:hypothetical protein [Acidimicrobiales bacterium]
MTATVDESRHVGAAEEVWVFDAADAAGGFGVVAWLWYRAPERVAWWWAGAVGLGPPLVGLRASDIPLPRRGTTVRTDGLWAQLECEEPLVHWSVAMECFGVAYDDPWEAARSERGDLVPFGLELSFVASEPPSPLGGAGYGQWCRVTGEVLLGDATVDVDCGGHRAHVWGGIPSPFARVRGTPGAAVAVCPFPMDGGVWVESLCPTDDGGAGGWVGRLT